MAPRIRVRDVTLFRIKVQSSLWNFMKQAF